MDSISFLKEEKMNKNLFLSRRNAIIIGVIALLIMLLDIISDKSSYLVLPVYICVIFDDTKFFKWLRPILLGLCAIICLFDFLPAMTAVTSAANILTVSEFVGSCLVSAGSVLMLLGSLYNFEYLNLFKAGAFSTGAGMLVPFIITTLIVAQNGAFNGIGVTDILSVLSVPSEAIFFISLCFLTKSKNSVNRLETDEEDGI